MLQVNTKFYVIVQILKQPCSFYKQEECKHSVVGSRIFKDPRYVDDCQHHNNHRCHTINLDLNDYRWRMLYQRSTTFAQLSVPQQQHLLLLPPQQQLPLRRYPMVKNIQVILESFVSLIDFSGFLIVGGSDGGVSYKLEKK